MTDHYSSSWRLVKCGRSTFLGSEGMAFWEGLMPTGSAIRIRKYLSLKILEAVGNGYPRIPSLHSGPDA